MKDALIMLTFQQTYWNEWHQVVAFVSKQYVINLCFPFHIFSFFFFLRIENENEERIEPYARAELFDRYNKKAFAGKHICWWQSNIHLQEVK